MTYIRSPLDPRLLSKLHQLGLDPFLLELVQHHVDEDGGVAVLLGASVESYNLHARARSEMVFIPPSPI